jgi:hypothetical protein
MIHPEVWAEAGYSVSFRLPFVIARSVDEVILHVSAA